MKKLLVCAVLLVSVAFSALVYAQGPVAVDPITRTIVIDKAVHFRDAENQNVLVPAGAYWITPEAEALELTNLDSEETFVIGALSGQHENQIAVPLALSIDATADQPDRHVIMYLFPDGLELAAAGSYSGVQPRGIPDQAPSFAVEVAKQQQIFRTTNALALASAMTAESGENTDALFNAIQLGTPVHFAGTEGQDLLVPAGAYWVTPKEETKTIELFNLDDGTLFVIVANTEDRVDDETDLIALSTSGTDDESDVHEVAVLLVDGSQLVAQGTYSGVRPRGLGNKLLKKRPQVKRTAKKLANTTRKVVQTTGETAGKAAETVGETVDSTVAGVKSAITARDKAVRDALNNFINDPNCAEPVLKRAEQFFSSVADDLATGLASVTNRSAPSQVDGQQGLQSAMISTRSGSGQQCGSAGILPCALQDQPGRMFCDEGLERVVNIDRTFGADDEWNDGLCLKRRDLFVTGIGVCTAGVITTVGGSLTTGAGLVACLPSAGGGCGVAVVGAIFAVAGGAVTGAGCGLTASDWDENKQGYQAMARAKEDKCLSLDPNAVPPQDPMLDCSDNAGRVRFRGTAGSGSDTAFGRNVEVVLACYSSLQNLAKQAGRPIR